MLGLEDYCSDESDLEPTSQAKVSPSSLNKSAFSLPPPPDATNVLPLRSSRVKSKRPVFTIAKPSKVLSDDEDEAQERAAKKPRLDSRRGAGSSSLLAMLPAPSKAAVVPAAPPKVLGSAAQRGDRTSVIVAPVDSLDDGEAFIDFRVRRTDGAVAKSTSLPLPSLAMDEKEPSHLLTDSKSVAPEIDFFSLGPATSRPTTASSTSKIGKNSGQSTSSMSITSAPTIPTFEPPPPTPSDPYPGYYQLPSGKWAAYEPDFYKKYYESWHGIQSLDSTSQKGFEGAEDDNTVEIDAQAQLDLARKEREEKKALTANAGRGPAAPNMNIKPPKIGSRARTRHQLSALLTEAYENREALEEKIAQGKRNRKEAGNKYGF